MPRGDFRLKPIYPFFRAVRECRDDTPIGSEYGPFGVEGDVTNIFDHLRDVTNGGSKRKEELSRSVAVILRHAAVEHPGNHALVIFVTLVPHLTLVLLIPISFG